MAKTLKKEVTVTEKKEVGFTDMELTIKKPVLGKDGSIVINGNFEVLAQQLTDIVEKYKGTVLTEDNVNYVKALKTQFQKLRTGIETKRKDWKKIYVTTPGKLLDAMCDDLQAIVAKGEDALGSQLEAFDQKRKDELTIILKDYVTEAVAKHSLREEYAQQIVLKEKYYNITQNEEDSADDIEVQAVELEKKQKEYDSAVLLIEAECKEADFLPDTYIRELQYKCVSEILLEIKSDKKTKTEIAGAENYVIGEPETSELEAELKKAEESGKEEMRTRVLRVTYRPDQAKLMAKFFRENNIAFEFIKTDF